MGNANKGTSVSTPLTLQELGASGRLALLVYDMQEGIFSQAPGLRSVIPQVVSLLEVARSAKVPAFFSRHTSLPKELMGMSQLRTAMIWQRTKVVEDVRSRFLPDSPETRLLAEVHPEADEHVFDKLGMSFFAGTPLDMALRDLGVNVVVIAGVVLEIGILPTVLHAIDLGYIPIVVADACGSVDAGMREHVLAYLAYVGTVVVTDTQAVVGILR